MKNRMTEIENWLNKTCLDEKTHCWVIVPANQQLLLGKINSLDERGKELEPVKCEKCDIVCLYRFKGTNRTKKNSWIKGSVQTGISHKYPNRTGTYCEKHSKLFY